MDPLMPVLRVIHIVLGVYWAGTIFFVVTFLEPVARGAGPAAGPVMLGLRQRRYFEILPAVAALTILSGLVLLWKVSGGLSGTWMGSRAGMTLQIGATAALVGFAIGAGVMRPATLRAMDLMPTAQQLPEGPERGARMEEIQALRLRARTAARWVGGLLLIAVGAMAVARYL